MKQFNDDGQCEPAKRIVIFDTLRGLIILSMVAFHATYDLAYLYEYDLPWFTSSPFQNIWRSSISWTFLIIAGWMTQHSRNNYKRGLSYAFTALLIYVVTLIANVDTPISFGIIYCMAFSTILYEAGSAQFKRINPLFGISICLALFVLTHNIPNKVYSFFGLSWLGFPAPGFASGDYYPPIPFFFMYAIGAYSAIKYLKGCKDGSRYPDWTKRDLCPPLTMIGRHSLAIYLVHQPIILAILYILVK